MRDNPHLDDVFLDHAGEPINRPARGQKRHRKRPALTRDGCRRHAFRVLALLAGLDAGERARVLALAGKINKA